MTTPGQVLSMARKSAGISLRAMAAHPAMPYTAMALSNYENNRRTIPLDLGELYSAVIGRPVDLPEVDMVRLAHEWLLDLGSSPSVEHRNAGQRIGSSLADALEQKIINLRLADDTVPGSDLAPLVRNELTELESILSQCSYSPQVGRRLLHINAELSQLAGWLAYVADGDMPRAEALYWSGAKSAMGTGDRPLVAWLVSGIAYQMATVGDDRAARDALLLTRSAMVGAPRVTPLQRVLLWERTAWASAQAGDERQCLAALDAVQEAHGDVGREAEPHRVYWLNQLESQIMRGRCLIALGRPGQAVPELTAAVAAYPTAHVREHNIYRCYLAWALADDGQVEAAEAELDAVAASGDTSARMLTLSGQIRGRLPRR